MEILGKKVAISVTVFFLCLKAIVNKDEFVRQLVEHIGVIWFKKISFYKRFLNIFTVAKKR